MMQQSLIRQDYYIILDYEVTTEEHCIEGT